jgi:hypothetical protein
MPKRISERPANQSLRPIVGTAMGDNRSELPINTDEFLAGTAHLTPEQLGCYCTLLFTNWRGRRIPETDAKLARFLGMSLRRWRAIRAPVMKMMAPFSRQPLRSKQLTQDEPPSPRFDYSGPERGDIEAAIGASLSERQWLLLRDAADQYRSSWVHRKQKTYFKPSERAATWMKAAQRCSELRKAIEVVAKTQVEEGDWRGALFWCIPEKLMSALTAKKRIRACGPWERIEVVDAGRSGGVLLTFGDTLDFLEEVENALRESSDPFYFKVSKVTSVTGRLDPSVVYAQRILWLWTTQFFGDLTCSWNPVAGEDSGPLVRYFFAVARPVMGIDTPSVQSLKKIVKRQKQFSKWYWELMCDSGLPGVVVAPQFAKDLEALRLWKERESKNPGHICGC